MTYHESSKEPINWQDATLDQLKEHVYTYDLFRQELIERWDEVEHLRGKTPEQAAREEMKRHNALDLVKDKEHWKNPIDTVITDAQLEEQHLTLNDIDDAVTHFTGSWCEFFEVKGKPDHTRVMAAGYFVAIGA